MPTLIGIRDGHRYTITVTRLNGATRIIREHHPECPCHKAASRGRTPAA
jgi:hypothetical protein